MASALLATIIPGLPNVLPDPVLVVGGLLLARVADGRPVRTGLARLDRRLQPAIALRIGVLLVLAGLVSLAWG